MTDRPAPGRSIVSRRAITDITRSAVRLSYGVTGVDAGPIERLRGRLGLGEPGIRVSLHHGIELDLSLTVAYGLPVAEVARQVDSAVRYGVRRATGAEVRRLTIHVDGLRYDPASLPPAPETVRPAPPAGSVVEEPVPEAIADEAAQPATDGATDGAKGPATDGVKGPAVDPADAA